MDIHRTEEETVEHLKQWLKDNGLAIVLGVVIGLSAIAGVRYWFTHARDQAEEASLIYGKVASALAAKKYVDVIQEGRALLEGYDNTSYAVLAALAMAKASLATGDAAGARRHLDWAMKHAADEGMQHVARIRLTRLYIDAKDYTAAMKLITDQPHGAFGSQYEELRGDILVAQNNPAQAREAYRLALVGAKDPTRRQFVQMKLDNLAAEVKAGPSASPAGEVGKQ